MGFFFFCIFLLLDKNATPLERPDSPVIVLNLVHFFSSFCAQSGSGLQISLPRHQGVRLLLLVFPRGICTNPPGFPRTMFFFPVPASRPQNRVALFVCCSLRVNEIMSPHVLRTHIAIDPPPPLSRKFSNSISELMETLPPFLFPCTIAPHIQSKIAICLEQTSLPFPLRMPPFVCVTTEVVGPHRVPRFRIT